MELAKSTKRSIVPKAKNLLNDSEAAHHYSNIIGGVVKLTKLMSDGREQIVGLQFAPDFLGRPFAENNAYSAETTTEVLLCSFPKKTLERIIAQSPDMEHRLFQQTLKELDEAREWILTLGRKTALEKVASFLCLIAENIDPTRGREEDTIRFSLPLTRSETADFLGLTIETVSRNLTKLRKLGMIDVQNRKQITVLSIKRLNALAGTE